MKCFICEKFAHIQCISFTREDQSSTTDWICTLCNHDLFPFQSLDTDVLHNVITSDSLNCDEMEFDLYANKIFDPFNLNEQI